MQGPSPDNPYPMEGFPQVCYLKNVISAANIEVGDYTYYDDPDGPESFERQNVLYHYPFIGDKLIIGKFCAIARGAKFIMNGANHKLSGFSTYPFGIFGQGWESAIPQAGDMPFKGNTVVGNDVWIGYNSLVMPGVQIGDGAIIAAASVVTKNVPPYTVVGGNPAQVIRRRYSDSICQGLQQIAWWNWNPAKITLHLPHIVGANLSALRTCSRMEAIQSLEQIAALADFAALVWREHYTPIIGAEQVEYMLQRFQSGDAITQQIQQGTRYFVLQSGTQLQAYFALQGNFLSKIYVHPEFRSQGIGRGILEYCRAELRRQGEKFLWLTVNRQNSQAIACYESLGFRRTGEVVQDIGSGYIMDDYRMEMSVIH